MIIHLDWRYVWQYEKFVADIFYLGLNGNVIHDCIEITAAELRANPSIEAIRNLIETRIDIAYLSAADAVTR
jgi:hypothetical protein